MKTSLPLSILIVDDHELILTGLKVQLSAFLPKASFDIYANGQDALRILKEKRHDLYVVDIELNGFSGIELIKEIRKIHRDAPVLVNTLHDEIWYVKELKALNVNGIILKSSSCKKLTLAVTEILNGRTFFCDKIKDMSSIHQEDNSHLLKESFSKHEYEILKLIGRGYKSREIAEIKAWSEKTVELYRKRLFDKFGVQNVARLVALAMKKGFLKKEDV